MTLKPFRWGDGPSAMPLRVDDVSSLRVVHRDGGWRVVGDYVDDGPFASNAEAWRRLDRLTNDPVSRAEAVNEWRLGREMNGQ